jgi:hypothetical protein
MIVEMRPRAVAGMRHQCMYLFLDPLLRARHAVEPPGLFLLEVEVETDSHVAAGTVAVHKLGLDVACLDLIPMLVLAVEDTRVDAVATGGDLEGAAEADTERDDDATLPVSIRP